MTNYNTDPDGKKAKSAIEKVVGYVKKTFRRTPITSELKGAAGKKSTREVLANRESTIEKNLKKARGY